MLVLGLVLLVLGVLGILAAIFLSEGEAQLVGLDLPVIALVLVGVVTGSFLVWGVMLTKRGSKREWRVRKDRRELRRYQEQDPDVRSGDAGSADDTGNGGS